MLDIRYIAKFKNDYKTIIKRGYNPKLLQDVLTILSNGQQLPPKYKDHNLSSNYEEHRECHITPDWMLIYKIEHDILTLSLTRTETFTAYLAKKRSEGKHYNVALFHAAKKLVQVIYQLEKSGQTYIRTASFTNFLHSIFCSPHS